MALRDLESDELTDRRLEKEDDLLVERATFLVSSPVENLVGPS